MSINSITTGFDYKLSSDNKSKYLCSKKNSAEQSLDFLQFLKLY